MKIKTVNMTCMGFLGVRQLWRLLPQSTSADIYGELINKTEGQLSYSIVTIRSI